MMRVSVLRGAGLVEVEQRPAPQPGPGEVSVAIGSVGVCGSDVHYYEHGRIGPYVVDSPLVLGHEAGGTVASVGPGVRGLSVGQRVSIEPGVPCRNCPQCLAGRYNLCPLIRFFATPPFDGAFAEYVVVPEGFAFAVPDNVSDDAAALIEPLSVGVWACRRAGVSPGCQVLVTGAGPIGLIAAQTARAYGAARVVITDVNPARLELAGELGLIPVDVSRPSSELPAEADVLLECTGNAQAAWDGLLAVGRAGRAVLIGMGSDELRLPLAHVQDHEITVTGAFRYANTWPTAISLAASGRVDLDRLVTGHYGLDEVEQALTVARRDPKTVKVMIRPAQR